MNTSLSSAFLQIGRLWERQKALLQTVQEARGFLSVLVERAIMVLLLKQVHLQKEGGAGGLLVWGNFGGHW